MVETFNSYNAFCNSLQRFDFKGTLGPEGMLASDWLLSCVKFCAKPHFSLKEVGLSLFLAKKLTFLKFFVGFLTFVLILVAGISKFRESHNKSQKCQFF